MRVDFYQLSEGTPESVVPLLARATLQAGERLLVVAADAALRNRIDAALWDQQPEAFLAHGHAGEEHAARQPILLSETCAADNGANFLLLADGSWREAALGFERVMLVFGSETLEATRAAWRALDGIEGAERRFWKQDGGRWREGP